MRNYIIILFFLPYLLLAQSVIDNPHQHNEIDFRDGEAAIANDTTYDANHYQIDIEIGIDQPYIEGSVSYRVTALKDQFSSLILDLDDAYMITSTSDNIASFLFAESQIKLYFSETYNTGDIIEFTIGYAGVPFLENNIKGLRYETHGNNEPIIASLSTPYLAHNWWPCKDGTLDKAESIAVNITIPDTTIAGIPVIALSNGTLQSTTTAGGKKTFHWTHDYPIVPYYVMVAISNFKTFEQEYDNGEQSFTLRYHVFEETFDVSQAGVEQMPNAMAFFCDIFGPYPFPDDGYAMTQLGYYGGIENQTNSIVGHMTPGWLPVSVHELAHQWFADMITCTTWNHAWINEGLASYSEALYFEHANGFAAYEADMVNNEFYGGNKIYAEDVSDPFNVFRSVIYKKGAYVLHMLRKVVGDGAFFEGLKTFATSTDFQYGHATTEDFQTVFEEVSGQNLGYFFHQWIYESGHPIYHYNFTQSATALNINIEQRQDAQGFYPLFTMPLDIEITYIDGSTEIVNYFNTAALQTFTMPITQEVTDIQLDPNKWVLKQSVYDDTVETTDLAATTSPFVLYPTLTQDEVNIRWSNEEDLPTTIDIFNTKGQYFSPQILKNNKKQTIKMKNLPPGTYFLKISTEKNHFSHKIVKY